MIALDKLEPNERRLDFLELRVGAKQSWWSQRAWMILKASKSLLYIKRNILSNRGTLYFAPEVRMRRASASSVVISDKMTSF